jgi:hypothetical protein
MRVVKQNISDEERKTFNHLIEVFVNGKHVGASDDPICLIHIHPFASQQQLAI